MKAQEGPVSTTHSLCPWGMCPSPISQCLHLLFTCPSSLCQSGCLLLAWLSKGTCWDLPPPPPGFYVLTPPQPWTSASGLLGTGPSFPDHSHTSQEP